jgi:DNA-binding transcriptional LysR family regulator
VLVVDGALPMEPVLRALKALLDARAPTRVRLHVEFLAGVQERFEREQADLMLVKDYAPSPLLAARPLPPVEMVLVAAAEHPLGRAEGAVGLAELHTHVELSVRSTGRTGADAHAFRGPRVFHLSDFETKRQALLHGLGFGWMPRVLVEGALREGALRTVPYDRGSELRFVPHLVHPLDRPLGRAGALLYEHLTAAPDPDRKGS